MLTDTKIKALRPLDKRYIVWDERDGLGVRVSVNGKKSFIVAYRFDGRSRMMTLDDEYPKLTLKAARTKASKAMEEIAERIDPGEMDQAKKAAHRNAYTVSDLVDEYMKRWAKVKKVTWKEDLRCLNKDVLPIIGKKKAKAVTRRDIVLVRGQDHRPGSKRNGKPDP